MNASDFFSLLIVLIINILFLPIFSPVIDFKQCIGVAKMVKDIIVKLKKREKKTGLIKYALYFFEEKYKTDRLK